MLQRGIYRKTRLCACLFVAALVMGCSVDPALRAARVDIPSRIAGADWPELLPIGMFSVAGPTRLPSDPAAIVARATSLRARAAALRAPVITPMRRAALRAALARNGY